MPLSFIPMVRKVRQGLRDSEHSGQRDEALQSWFGGRDTLGFSLVDLASI
jgi:hypothetical protein